MKLFGWNLTRAAATPLQRSFPPAALSWLRGDELDHGHYVLSNAYQQVVWVYRSINVLAEQVANIPFLFSSGERGREQLITSGPLHDFYSRPHPQINRFQYWELRIIWLMLRGECFRVPVFENDSRRGRRLRRVLLLDPAHFQHIIDNHQLVGWRYTGFGRQAPLASQLFLPEEVWFEKLPNPFDFWRGLPPLQAASMAARTDFAASAFMRGIIENNADTGVIVRADRPLAPEQQEQLLAALRDRKRRAGRADQPLLVTGCAEIIKPQLSSSDLQFLENRKFSRSEICAAFGVPEEILTATEHAKYDVMQGARLNFIENRVAPLCGRLEAEEDATVKAIDPKAVGWFDLDSLPLMQNARRERLTAARAGFDMGIPFNELNRVLDLGFKPLPWGETGFVPAKLRPLGNAVSAEQTSKEESRTGEKQSGLAFDPLTLTLSPSEGERGCPAPDSALRRLDHFLTLCRSKNQVQVEGLDASGWAKVKARQLKRFLFEQRGRVLEALGRLAQTKEVVTNDCTPSPGAAFDAQARQELSITALLDLPAEDERLYVRVLPLLQPDTEAEARRQPGADDTAAQQQYRAEFEAESRRRLAAFNQNTFEALQHSLNRGLANRESLAQLADRVRAIYNDATNRWNRSL